MYGVFDRDGIILFFYFSFSGKYVSLPPNSDESIGPQYGDGAKQRPICVEWNVRRAEIELDYRIGFEFEISKKKPVVNHSRDRAYLASRMTLSRSKRSPTVKRVWVFVG